MTSPVRYRLTAASPDDKVYTAQMIRGMAEGISQGASYSQFGDAFGQVARGGWGGLPFAGWAFAALALAFAVHATTTENQSLLMNQAFRVPANVKVDTTDVDPAIAGFLSQAQLVTVPPNVAQMTTIREQGEQMYKQLLESDKEPSEIACDFLLNASQTIEVPALPSPCTSQE